MAKSDVPRVTLRSFASAFAESFGRNQPLDLAAQLAYFAVLSIFPFAMFLLTIVGYLPLDGLDQEIMGVVYRVMPPDAAKLTDQTIHEIIGKQRGWLLLSALGFAIYSASGGVSALITALNRAYDVAETRPFWKVKLLALGVTFGSILAIIVTTASMAIGPGLVHQLWEYFGLGGAFDIMWGYARWPLAVLTIMFTVAFMYWVLPNVRQRWRFITPGSVVAVLAWLLASSGFRLYVSNFGSYAKTYGALGTVVVLMMWLYLSGLTIIVGGEINAILDRLHHGIVHTEDEPGPVTVPDQGEVKGEAPGEGRAPLSSASSMQKK